MERYFDVKAQGRKSTRDRPLIRLLKSPGLMISASGISNTIFLPSSPKATCSRLKLLSQEKQNGKDSVIIKEETVALIDKLLEYNCNTPIQHKNNY